MGMTDKQFSGFLRLVLDDLIDIQAELDPEGSSEKLKRLIAHLQDTIED